MGRGIGKGDGLPGVKVVANVSGLNLMPSASKLGVDLGGGGMIGGDVTYEAKDVGVALDQMAREILRHLSQHKLTVVWLFDESESMKDDQKAIRDKFDRVANELKVNLDDSRKQAAALNHAIVGFGEGIHYELKKPTANIDQIGEAIDRLKIDSTGTENTMHAVQDVVATYSGMLSKDRRLLIVLVTDESGDDGDFVEEAHQAVMSMKVPIYVIGRQSLFGFSRVRLRYVDPVTKDVYWPLIRRGPETAEVEQLQWDGLHDRWDEQPSGFAPYELARLAKDTGGIYFLLPSEENLRNIRNREQTLFDEDPQGIRPRLRGAGGLHRQAEPARTSAGRSTTSSWRPATSPSGFTSRSCPTEMKAAANEAGIRASAELKELVAIQKKLESLKKLRDREPHKRWQAHFDLMLAQIVVYQIKAYEYRACMADMIKTVPKPKTMPTADLMVEWDIHHSKQRMAPKEETERSTPRPASCSPRSSSFTPIPPGPTWRRTRSTAASASGAASGTTTPSMRNARSLYPSIESPGCFVGCVKRTASLPDEENGALHAPTFWSEDSWTRSRSTPLPPRVMPFPHRTRPLHPHPPNRLRRPRRSRRSKARRPRPRRPKPRRRSPRRSRRRSGGDAPTRSRPPPRGPSRSSSISPCSPSSGWRPSPPRSARPSPTSIPPSSPPRAPARIPACPGRSGDGALHTGRRQRGVAERGRRRRGR